MQANLLGGGKAEYVLPTGEKFTSFELAERKLVQNLRAQQYEPVISEAMLGKEAPASVSPAFRTQPQGSNALQTSPSFDGIEGSELPVDFQQRVPNAPRSSLNLQISDADLNMDEVDKIFTNHLKTGYPYS